MQKLTIGFVGLGAMGSLCARRLLEAGHAVQGYDLQQSALDEFARQGGQPMPSAEAVVHNARITLLFVVNAQQAESVLSGEQGLAGNAAPGHIVVSCVTMSAADASRLAQQCEQRGLVYLDAPVSGGTAGAAKGTLSIMASGSRQAMEICEPIFAELGHNVLHVGETPGQGATFKIINQMLCGVHLAVAGEALAMAARAGLDTQQVFDLVSRSAASSWMLSDRGPAMVARDYSTVNSAVDIFVKDLALVSDLARDLRFPAVVSAAALQSFLGASGAGLGHADDAAVTEFYRLARIQSGN